MSPVLQRRLGFVVNGGNYKGAAMCRRRTRVFIALVVLGGFGMGNLQAIFGVGGNSAVINLMLQNGRIRRERERRARKPVVEDVDVERDGAPVDGCIKSLLRKLSLLEKKGYRRVATHDHDD